MTGQNQESKPTYVLAPLSDSTDGNEADDDKPVEKIDEEEGVSTGISLTATQARLLRGFMVACNFLIANGNSLQGPFYPKEAESKGASPLMYSAIFASYELTMLLTSFLFNHVADRYRANLLIGLALIFAGIATIIFGTLTFLSGTVEFIVASFLTRIAESLGATLFAICTYSYISVCFPTSIGATFGMMEMAFGLGMISGPVVGSIFYTVGGFFLPFAIVGSMIVLLGSVLLSPRVERLFERAKKAGIEDAANLRLMSSTTSASHEDGQEMSLREFLGSSAILFDGYLIVSAIMLVSFNTASLEPHLRHSGIATTPLLVSALFISEGLAYSVGAMILGPFLDKHVRRSADVSLLGSVAILGSLVLLAPLPGIETHFQPGLLSNLICLFVLGVGVAAKQTAGYSHAMHHTLHKRKAKSNQQTYGYVAAMFFTCLSLGGFLGPIVAGSFVERWNYRVATLAMFIIECFTFTVTLAMKLLNSTYRL